MRRNPTTRAILLLMAALLHGSCADDPQEPAADGGGGTGDAASGVAQTRIYVSFVSHNEEQPHATCSPMLTDNAKYLANRALTLQFAKMIVDTKAAWDFQSDWEYLEAVKKWDSAKVTVDSGGKNIVRYLAELAPDQIMVEAHAHETAYNYADVVHLLEGLGVKRNGVVGGFIYYPADKEAWTRLRSPLKGLKYPSVSWSAEILWGAGTSQHTGPDSRAAGIWRPRDATHFHQDDPSRKLVNVGGYGSQIDALLAKLKAGDLQKNRLYTASIFVNQCSLSVQEISKFKARVIKYVSEVKAGNLVWATLPTMVKQWREKYTSEPVILQLSASGQDAGTGGNCGTCPKDTVCCPSPMSCAGKCVPDCRVKGNTCPSRAPTCNIKTGICGK